MKENNLRMQKKHEEWVQKVARIMKKKQAQIDHMKKKNELYKGHILVESSDDQLDQLAEVADQLATVATAQDKE